jgi:protein-histidine pros-kinase
VSEHAPAHGFAWAQSAFGGLLEAAPDAMVVVDESGRIVLVNSQVLAMFGYDPEELVGQPVEQLIPQAARGAHAAHRQGYVGTPRVRVMGSGLDLRACRKDGSEFPVEVSLSPMHTPEGLLVCAAIRDVTRRRREEDLFRGLLEAAPDAMVIVDQSGRIQLVNAQVEKLFGYERAELIGRPVEILVPERFAAHRSFRGGYVHEPRTRPMGLAGDLFARRKDDTEFPVEISLSPLQTDEGVLVSAAVRDISERRSIEDATARAKDEFFATVSHELRTPLTSLIGYGELLSDLEPLTEQGRRFLTVMLRSAERELRLVDDLLTLVQIEEGGLSILPTRLDVVAVVTDAVEAARPHAEESGLALRLDVPGHAVPVDGDGDRLGQAVDNLLSNAIKFTPHGGSVSVALRVEGEQAVIDVSDTGPGVGAEDVERLFERLYRASGAVEQQVPGAGLGLTITRAIVDAHGGTIGIPHTDTDGTTFRIALPLRTAEVAPAGSGAAPATGQAAVRSSIAASSASMSPPLAR